MTYTVTEYGSINTGSKDITRTSDTTSQANNDAVYKAVSTADANAVYTGVDYLSTSNITTD